MYDLPSRHRTLRPVLVGAVVTATAVTVGLAVSRATPAHARTVVHVSTASELGTALAAATPGQTIALSDGVYEGEWTATGRSGTPSAPITLTGTRHAVLRTPDGDGAVLALADADYWTVSGLTVEHGDEGIVVSSSDHVVVEDVLVHDLAAEGVRFRASSRHGLVREATVTDTGRAGRGSGGIVVGTPGSPTDRSDYLTVRDNVVGPLVRGAGVVAEAGTTGGLVVGNLFDGTGAGAGAATGSGAGRAADAWVVVGGNRYAVEDNRGLHAAGPGFATVVADGWGCDTEFRGNTADLSDASRASVVHRYGIEVVRPGAAQTDPPGVTGSPVAQSRTVESCPTTVYDDNEVVGGDGLVPPGMDVVAQAGSDR